MKKRSLLCNRIGVAAAIASLAACLAFGQATMQPQSLKGAVIKGKAPVSKEVLRVALPKAFETKLGNGLQVIVLENHKLPTFAMQMVILSGGISDPPGKPGVAMITAQLLREGTKTRNSKQIAEEVDSLGASLMAGSSLSSTESMVTGSGLTDNLDQLMALFADVILNPTFPADELNKLKTRMVAQLRMARSQPGFLAMEMFNKVIYPNHPASRVLLTADEIQALKPEMLVEFHSTYFRPNNAILAMVGDVKPAEIVARLEKAFASWQRGDVPATATPKTSEPGTTKIYVVDRPGSVQTNFILGTQTIERTDPDYYALQVMNRIVGGGPSGRLFMNLREDKGYTYGAYSNTSAGKWRGTFQASAQVRTAVTDGSMKEFMYELNRIRDEKAPPEEFDNSKRAIVGSFALQLESPQSILQNILTQKIYGLPSDYWDTYPQKISAQTADDIQKVARKYIDLSRLQVVAVGDAKQIVEPLRKYGTVEVYDSEGKPVKPATTIIPGQRPDPAKAANE